MPAAPALPLLALLGALLAGCLTTAPPAPAPPTPGPAPEPCAEPPGLDPGAERPFGHVVAYGDVVGPATEGVVVCGPHVLVTGTADGAPSLLVLDRATGQEVERFEIPPGFGATLALGSALDAQGRLYVAMVPTGVVRLARGPSGWSAELYAEVPDLAPCTQSAPPCAPTRADGAPFPNMPAFDARGNLYLTDTFQATIWRVPPGGGAPEPWFQDARFDCAAGVNGLAVHPAEQRLYAVVFGAQPTDPAGLARCPSTDLWRLPLAEAPAAEDLERVHAYEPSAGGDGLLFGASGRMYVTLNMLNQLSVLEGSQEVARLPTALANAAAPERLDAPANIAFLDERRSLVLTNLGRAFEAAGVPPRILDVYVDDTALPVPRPVVP